MNADQRIGKILVSRNIEHHLIRIRHPVKIAPHLHSINFLWLDIRGQVLQRMHHADHYRHMRIMLVGWIVRVNNRWPGSLADFADIRCQPRA